MEEIILSFQFKSANYLEIWDTQNFKMYVT